MFINGREDQTITMVSVRVNRMHLPFLNTYIIFLSKNRNREEAIVTSLCRIDKSCKARAMDSTEPQSPVKYYDKSVYCIRKQPHNNLLGYKWNIFIQFLTENKIRVEKC